MKHRVNVEHIWWKAIKSNKKTVEGRLNKGVFAEIKKNDRLEFVSNKTQATVTRRVYRVTKYKTFHDYLVNEGLRRTLPTVTSLEDGIAVYRKFYSEEKERTYNVLAIAIK